MYGYFGTVTPNRAGWDWTILTCLTMYPCSSLWRFCLFATPFYPCFGENIGVRLFIDNAEITTFALWFQGNEASLPMEMCSNCKYHCEKLALTVWKLSLSKCAAARCRPRHYSVKLRRIANYFDCYVSGLFHGVCMKFITVQPLTRPLERVWELRALEGGGAYSAPLLSRLPEMLETRNLGGG